MPALRSPPGVVKVAEALGTKAFDETLLRMFHRVGLDDLPEHLGSTHGIEVTGTFNLDVGVVKVDRADGPPWVARVFSALRPVDAAAGDVAVLRWLQQQDFPAERLAAAEPLSVLAGQAVVVTEYATPVKQAKQHPGPTLATLAGLLAELASAPLPEGRAARPAGALHHFADGGFDAMVAAAHAWLDQIEDRVPAPDRSRLDVLRAALSGADTGEGLPRAFIHPDTAPKNIVRTAGGPVFVDWTGAGIGPRLLTLRMLLWPSTARDLVSAYESTVELTDEERSRFGALLLTPKLVDLAFRISLHPEKTKAHVAKVAGLRRETQRLAAAALGTV